MRITVILCTYNRCQILARALESVAHSRVPEAVSWQVLVVDNNSKDKTRSIAEEFCRTYPGRFRYIFQPIQGKSQALNKGLQEANGDVIAFMDDDVVVEPGWLWSLTEPLQEGKYLGTGGRICAPKDITLPDWISLKGDCSLAGVLALFDRGESVKELGDPPYGTNMAFRRDAFTKFGIFRTDLGPSVGSEIRGEDTEFCLRLMNAGVPILYVPTAVVYHEVPANRLRKKYFLRWYFDYGRALIRTRGRKADVGMIPRPLIGFVNHMVLMFPAKLLRWLTKVGAKERFFAKTQLWMIVGEAVELYQQWSRASSVSKQGQSQAVSQP